MDKAHVEHGVRLIQNEVLELSEVDVALIDEVKQSPWRGHNNVYAAFERSHLFALLHATKNDGVMNRQVLGIILNALANLSGQLSRWTQNERANDLSLVWSALLVEAVKHRQRKSGRFSCACLGNAKDVSALDDMGNGLRLNGGGGLVTKRFEGPHEGFAQTERVKIGQKNGVFMRAMPSMRYRRSIAKCVTKVAIIRSTVQMVLQTMGNVFNLLWVNRWFLRAGFRPVQASLANPKREAV